MNSYVELEDYANAMGIKKGDFVFISSDSRIIMIDALRYGKDSNLNRFIDGLVKTVGEDGTIVFPTYNWDFCKNIAFDYFKTPSKTGYLSSLALLRKDFKRTKHAIYSFAVYGKYQQELCELNNESSFGGDSPFAFFKEHNTVNFMIDVGLDECFTFVHYVQEQSGDTSNRYLKSFNGEYIDENGETTQRTYSMFVRKLELNVINKSSPIEGDLLKNKAISYIKINSSNIKRLELNKCYDVILEDILFNNSRKLCSFIGQ